LTSSFSGEELLERVVRFLDRAKFGDAQRLAEQVLRRSSDSADCHYALGLVLTQLDRIPEADRAFARAAELCPEDYFLPYRLQREAFERVVEEVLASLPTEFGRHLENVEVAVEEVPGRKLLREGGIEHDTLGLYQGATIQSGDWGFPDRVTLFQRNLENISPAPVNAKGVIPRLNTATHADHPACSGILGRTFFVRPGVLGGGG